jgi:hypothetical protein
MGQAMTTTTRTKHDVYSMSEGEILVRGTLDPVEAVRLVVEDPEDTVIEDCLWGVSREEDNNGDRVYGDHDQSAVQAMANRLHWMLATAKPGLYRKNPCGKGTYGDAAGWKWQLGYGTKRGHGTFEGVLFE